MTTACPEETLRGVATRREVPGDGQVAGDDGGLFTMCARTRCMIGFGLSLMLTGCGKPNVSRRPVAREEQATVRVAGIVLKWVTAERETNFARAEPLIREAAAKGAEIVVTTECFLDGYAIRDKSMPIEDYRALGETIPGGPYVKRLQELADELNIHLVAGMVERVGETTYNAAVLIGPDGSLLGKYRKQEIGHERVRNSPGDQSPVFETAHGRIGLMICADRRYPDLVRRLGDNQADLILCPSGGMWGPIKNDFHLQDRSRENDVPIVFVHPIEFLITARDGSILDRRFVGRDMDIPVGQILGSRDQRLVAIYDVPISR